MRKNLFIVTVLILITAFSASAQTDDASMFDAFGSIPCEDYLLRMDAAIVQASNVPGAKVYVMVYEGKLQANKIAKSGSSTMVSSNPQFGLANARIASMKKYLAIKRVQPSSFAFVKGGFREDFTVELFLVQDGKTAPVATPTVSKIKYRKGRPAGFCTRCCGP